ncbi:MAG TPA: hypothetical protein GX392_04090 [Clostridiales bacterium]|nr:hypothetical protein [Clostridiales bacterium]
MNINDNIILFDGAIGTMLQKLGLASDECPEIWNDTHPELVKKVHNAYKKSGSIVIQTNTFGGNSIKLKKFGLDSRVDELNSKAVYIAKEIMDNDGYVAASIGPTGEMLVPYGTLTFDNMYDAFKEQIISITNAGADIIIIETMMDLIESRIALLAAIENSNLPIICSSTFETQCNTLMGNPPESLVSTLQSLGASSVGANCSGGPLHLLPIIQRMKVISKVPLIVQPNAGLPTIMNGNITYSLSPEDMAKQMIKLVDVGANMLGGCCGTTPEHIYSIGRSIVNLSPIPPIEKISELICSPYKFTKIENIEKRLLDIEITSSMEPFDILDILTECDILNPIPCVRFHESMYSPHLINKFMSDFQSIVKEPVAFVLDNTQMAEIILRAYHGRAAVILDNNHSKEIYDIIEKYGAYII